MKGWHPVLSVYYLTYDCQFLCPYCSDGNKIPYHRLPKETLPAAEVLEVLKAIRRHCDYLVITGGEPLLHPDFAAVMDGLIPIAFKEVVLTTNGYGLERFLPHIMAAVSTLVFSVDTLDKERADSTLGRGPGKFDQILSNIELAASQKGGKPRIVISAVATTANVHDLFDVYSFARNRGFTFSTSPVLEGVKAPEELTRNPAYRKFYDFLIEEKKKGADIHGSVPYLKYMRDFAPFSCRPFTMLVVDPMGRVFYPCLEIGHLLPPIQELPDLDALKEQGLRQFGPKPTCGNQCHSPCALGFAVMLAHPWSVIHEGYLGAARRLKTFICRKARVPQYNGYQV